MTYDPRPMYEINASEPKIKRPKTPWADQVKDQIINRPRGERVSPLLEEYLKSQDKK